MHILSYASPRWIGSNSHKRVTSVALWAARYAEEALAIFESRHPDDMRPREAIEAGRDFGNGKKRDKNLRMSAFAAMKSKKGVDDASKYAAQAAVLTAAVAYTHTDLQTGLQGVRQAQHLLGPVVFAALAVETAANDSVVGDVFLEKAVQDASVEVRSILARMPSQPQKSRRLDALFSTLDSGLRM